MSDHRKCPRDFSQSATLDFKSVPMGGGVLACFDPQWPDSNVLDLGFANHRHLWFISF